MSEPGLRVLVVDDEPPIRKFLRVSLTAHGHQVFEAATGRDALAAVITHRPDLVILDLGLPDMDGIQVTRTLREWTKIPILILSVREHEQDKIAALDAGADDYLTKPFAFRELLARVRALARRRGAPLPETLKVSDLEVDLEAQRVRRAGKPIELTAKEFSLLEFFVLHPGQVVDRAAITAHVWDENHDPFTNVLEVLVRRLRRKIDDDFPVKLIQTVRGSGYRFGD